MTANALIYHPTVTHYLRFVATTAGRDKLLRTIQYFSRFYAWYLYRTNTPTRLVAPFKTIVRQFALCRKTLRLGKNVEHIKAAALAYDSKSSLDEFQRYCTVGRQLGYAMYLSLDMMTFLDSAGIRKWEGAKRVQREAMRAWAVGLLFSMVAGGYGLLQLRRREKGLDRKEGEGVVEGKKIARERDATRIQLVSDVCDLAIPGSALGWAELDDGLVGLAGTASSLIGVMTTWNKTA
ncbi:MAG: hypothetical protein LQ351_005679 [Letrouitia transgressa]|nr:MAG: hypothetical protein LQ351_005679 [Letrouitia transgressa]